MSEVVHDWNTLAIPWNRIAIPAGIIVGAVVISLVIHYLFFAIVRRFGRREGAVFERSVAQHCYAPVRLVLPAIALDLTLPLLHISREALAAGRHTVALILIAALAWLLIGLLRVVTDMLLSHYQLTAKDNLRARKIYTQMQVFHKVTSIVIGVLTVAIMLMTFSWARELGASLLASAGIIGLVVGIAARPALSNLVAGIQLALTEPIRIDDVVIVENEWGWIEDITSTYVVVRIWDLRRLVVPISYFIEKPFQNWTRVTANLLGSVFLYLDYTAPIEPIRQELNRIVKETPRWDGNVCVLQVTDTSEHAVQIRALVSAADSGTAWDLRCEVREKLLNFIQRNYPDSLPKSRAVLPEVNARIVTGSANGSPPPGNPASAPGGPLEPGAAPHP